MKRSVGISIAVIAFLLVTLFVPTALTGNSIFDGWFWQSEPETRERDTQAEQLYQEVLNQQEFEGFDDPPTSSSRQQPCTTNVPAVITSSMRICSGTYNQEIIIAADDVVLECDQGTIFDGKHRLKTGLGIYGGYKNIEVRGCAFVRYSENGIHLEGGGKPVHKPGPLTDVTLESVRSSDNSYNTAGLLISHNVERVQVTDSEFSDNIGDGIKLFAEYTDPTVLKDPKNTPEYLFPKDIRIYRNNILRNSESGIVLDGSQYFRLADAVEAEKRTIDIAENTIYRNHQYGIRNTDFFVDRYPGVLGKPIGYYRIHRNKIEKNSRSGIFIDTRKNFNDINEQFKEPQQASYVWNGIHYITQNEIKNNKGFAGIRFDAIHRKHFPIGGNGHSVASITGNIITENQDGIQYYDGHIRPTISSKTVIKHISQNKITKNRESGIWVHVPNPQWATKPLPPNYERYFETSITCNDILDNQVIGIGLRAAPKSFGTHIPGEMNVGIHEKNIIERSIFGYILYGHHYNEKSKSTIIAEENYIGENNFGAQLRLPRDILPKPELHVLATRNDLINNQQQGQQYGKTDQTKKNWEKNYWSDYSPSCSNTQNQQCCDNPKLVQADGEDPRPAKNLYNIKERGYLEIGSNGYIIPNFFCEWTDTPEPPIMLPPKRNKGNETKNDTGTKGIGPHDP